MHVRVLINKDKLAKAKVIYELKQFKKDLGSIYNEIK